MKRTKQTKSKRAQEFKPKLKACPFCGGKAEWNYGEYVREFWINCRSRLCDVHPCSYGRVNSSDAAKIWNTRVVKRRANK